MTLWVLNHAHLFIICFVFAVGKAPTTVRSPPVNLARINQTGKGDSKVIDELNLQVSRDSYYHGTKPRSWSFDILEATFHHRNNSPVRHPVASISWL